MNDLFCFPNERGLQVFVHMRNESKTCYKQYHSRSLLLAHGSLQKSNEMKTVPGTF